MRIVQFNTGKTVRPGAFKTKFGDWQPTVAVIQKSGALCVTQRVDARGMGRRESKWAALTEACRMARKLRRELEAGK